MAAVVQLGSVVRLAPICGACELETRHISQQQTQAPALECRLRNCGDGFHSSSLHISSLHHDSHMHTWKVRHQGSSSRLLVARRTPALLCAAPSTPINNQMARRQRRPLPPRAVLFDQEPTQDHQDVRRRAARAERMRSREDREPSRQYRMFGESIVPSQAEVVTAGGVGPTTFQEGFRTIPDLDYLQELLAIQQQGPRNIGFFGTRNMGFMHQQLIEILSYAMVITKNHIYTSGSSGTNAAVIRGALRAEAPDLLTVILPQSLSKQPPESQELLAKVKNVTERPFNDHLPLIEASRLCNNEILSLVQQVICFAFHDSNLLMETCREAKELRKIVTLFYLD